jgi:glutathione synthase/RimK-type ligase-like ATP-grasp enzyme
MDEAVDTTDQLITILSTCALSDRVIADVPQMLSEAAQDQDPGNMYLRVFYILLAFGQNELALQMQKKALKHRCVYRIANPSVARIRLLAIMGPGDLRDNTPLDFLIERSDIRLELLFVSTEINVPAAIPDHDVAFIALNESTKNWPILDKVAAMLEKWPRPYINDPQNIVNCARHTASRLLQNIPGLYVPETRRIHRGEVGECVFPAIIRPVDTHGGKNLKRVNSWEELGRFFEEEGADAEAFYISEFVDYRSDDGCYRKMRIVLIDRKPYICHFAISPDWIVHYAKADMESSAEKKAEEALFMENFDVDFAVRHQGALSAIADRLELDYVVIDCSELRNGELLFFEADVAGWVHAKDAIDTFPYKPRIMQKAFDAFRAMLLNKSGIASADFS